MSDAFSILKSYFKSKIEINDEEFGHWKTYFVLKEVRKGKFLLTEKDHCRYLSFVCKGCLRSFTIDTNGVEHIIQFAPENWWISDLNSFTGNEPSLINIDAIVDSTVLQIDHDSYSKLFDESQKWSAVFLNLLQKSRAASEKRILSYLNSSAEERYLIFMKYFSGIAPQIPQHMIASYLGITPESLSRIRKHLADSK
ncbi:MAG: Crp/Fnr family transcriptional regulator [Bacteroidia bacterium]